MYAEKTGIYLNTVVVKWSKKPIKSDAFIEVIKVCEAIASFKALF